MQSKLEDRDTAGSGSGMIPEPCIVNDYNVHMGGVDITDQYQSAFKTQRKAYRNRFPLFCWVIDDATINAFKVGGQLDLWTKAG